MNEDYPRTWMELEARFQDEHDCLAYLQVLRWPEGLRCPCCGSQRAWLMKRSLWLCQDCRHQTSVLAGTVFQDTKLPLTLWFRAMWQVANYLSMFEPWWQHTAATSSAKSTVVQRCPNQVVFGIGAFVLYC